MKEILSIAIEQEFTRDRHLSPLLFKCIRMLISNFIESDPVSCVLILDRAYPRFAACIVSLSFKCSIIRPVTNNAQYRKMTILLRKLNG